MNGSRPTAGGGRSRRGAAPRGLPGGFTLIEVLVVLAVLGLIAAMVIPYFIDAMHRAKQRRTMGDMHHVGTAMTSWLNDQVAGAAAAGMTVVMSDLPGPVPPSTMESRLTPQYIQWLPRLDGWGHPYEFYLAGDATRSDRLMAIRSPGRDGAFSGETYTQGSFAPTAYDEDLVWLDGYFVRYPAGSS